MNNVLKNYLNTKDENYEKILSRTEELNKKEHHRSIIFNITVVSFCVILIGTISYAKRQWDTKFIGYSDKQLEETNGLIHEAEESDYVENFDTDYLFQDKIGVKLNSILKGDKNFEANLTFKFSEDTTVDSRTFGYGYIVYDEENNIYGFSVRLHPGDDTDKNSTEILPHIFEESGLKKYNPEKDTTLASGSYIAGMEVNEEEKTIRSSFSISPKTKFPDSKKIFIRVFDLGYYMVDKTLSNEERMKSAECFTLSNSDWLFEIDIPD